MSILHSFFGNKAKAAQRMTMQIADIIADITKTPVAPTTNYITMEACFVNADGEDVDSEYAARSHSNEGLDKCGPLLFLVSFH